MSMQYEYQYNIEYAVFVLVGPIEFGMQNLQGNPGRGPARISILLTLESYPLR